MCSMRSRLAYIHDTVEYMNDLDFISPQNKEKEPKTSHSKSQVSSLRQELAKKDAELKSLRDKSKAEIERKVAEKDAKRKSENASLQKQISDLKGQLEIKNAQLEESCRLANTREAEKKQLRKEADKLKGQLLKQVKTDSGKDKRVEIDQLTAEIDDLRGQLQIKGAQVKDLSQLASTRGEEKEWLAREVERLKGELQKIEQTKSEGSKTKKVEIDRLTAEISDLKRQLHDKNAQIRDLSQTVNHQGEEKEQFAKEAERLQGELLKLQQSRSDDRKTNQTEINRLTREIRDFRGQLQTKNARVDELNQLASTQREEKKKFEREADDLKRQLLRVHQVRNDDSKAKQAEVEQLSVKISTLKGQLQIKNAQVEDLSQLASTRGEEKEQLENDMKQLQDQLFKMEQARSQLMDDNRAKLVRIDELTTQLTSLSRQMEQQGRETEQLKHDLTHAKNNIAELVEATRTAKLRAGGDRPDAAANIPVVNSGRTLNTAPAVNNDRTCPMCQKQFPKQTCTQEEYERHVQSHF